MDILNFQAMIMMMTTKNLPMPEILLGSSIVLQIAGGILLVTGQNNRLAAAALMLFIIPTTFIFHNFWVSSDTAEYQEQLMQFLKNIAILGGLLIVFSQEKKVSK